MLGNPNNLKNHPTGSYANALCGLALDMSRGRIRSGKYRSSKAKSMKSTELRVHVLLTMQVALLGMVTANMRSVLVSWTETSLNVHIVFDDSMSPADSELASEIESEVISHLPSHAVICRTESRLPLEKVIPSTDEVFVFQRAHL